jgi:DNA-binding Lrp family transcriptional regulator
MDSNDLKILEILNDDSRTPYDLIGKKVSLTGNAVRTRVLKMLEDGVIEKFVFKIHPEIFDIVSSYVQFSCAKKIDAAETINKILGPDPRYPEIISSIDGTNIVQVSGVGEKDLQLALDNLRKKLSNVTFGLVIKRFSPHLEKIKINNSLLKVINCLTTDVRMSVADLAKECNATSKSIKYYLSQIEQLKIGRFSLNYQPYKISRRIFVNFFICKQDSDYIHFANMYDMLNHDLKSSIFKYELLIDPPGIYLNVTSESLEEIDQIELKIRNMLKGDYIFHKMFPSRTVYRENLIHKIIHDQIAALEKASD